MIVRWASINLPMFSNLNIGVYLHTCVYTLACKDGMRLIRYTRLMGRRMMEPKYFSHFHFPKYLLAGITGFYPPMKEIAMVENISKLLD